MLSSPVYSDLNDKVSHVSLEVEADQEGGVSPLASLRGLVTSGGGDQIKLGELHVAGNVDTPPCGPVVRNVLGGVAKLK